MGKDVASSDVGGRWVNINCRDTVRIKIPTVELSNIGSITAEVVYDKEQTNQED